METEQKSKFLSTIDFIQKVMTSTASYNNDINMAI